MNLASAQPSRGVLEGRGGEWAILGVSLVWTVIIWAWPSAYLALTVDDSFYYLQTARNIAAGFGATFDRVEPTDGYHPLWCYGLALGFRVLSYVGLNDTATLMRLVLTVQASLVAGAGCVLSRGVWRAAVPWLALLLTCPYGAKIVINGQESALQFALLVLALAVLARGLADPNGSWRRAVSLGSICGLCALTRLEAALFGVATIGVLAVHGTGSRAIRRRDALVACISFVVLGAAYWVVHYLQTGHWVPVSAVIKAERAEGASFATLVVGAALLPFAVWLWRAAKTRLELLALLPLWAYVLGLQGYFLIVRGEFIPEIWYWPPHAVLAVVLLSHHGAFQRWQRSGALASAALGLGATLLIGASWAYRAVPSSHARYAVAADLGPWLDDHTDDRALVASWDAGIVAAHTARPVTNLDGLINSWQFKLKYLDTGATDQYLRERGIDYLVQYFPVSWLKQQAFRWNGVDLSTWRVVEARFFELRRVGHFWRTERNVFLVLARNGTAPHLTNWAGW